MCFDYSKICKFEEKEVVVYIKHKIYGDQKIYSTIKFINDGKHIGVHIGTHEIFLFVEEVKNIKANENVFAIEGELMTIQINR